MTKANNIESMFKPDASLIRQHLDYICEGMNDYQDGCIEIAYGNAHNVPNMAKSFCISDLDEAVKFACEKNSDGRNVYVVGAVLDPNRESLEGRSNDDDFYATKVVWADIDNADSVETIRQRYEKLPPSKIVVTGREPNTRAQLWWTLQEPIADAEELREVLDGLAVNLGGDPMVKNPTSLMRLGGTVNWQTEKKRSRGRRVEMTEVKTPSNASKPQMVDSLLLAYPVPKEFNELVVASVEAIKQQPSNTLTGALNLIEIKDDGREQYMHEMLCAAIVHLTAQLGRWPTADEVFADAWPIYASKVHSRAGMTLDQEGRGARVMRSKIKSKLGAFVRGRIRGARDVTEIIRNNPMVPIQANLPATISSAVALSGGEAGANALANFKLTDWIASSRYQGVAKPIAWLIEGLFPLGVPVLLAAMGGLGKSFVALDMGIKVASPKPLLSLGSLPQSLGHNVMDHGKVVFLTAEDSFDSIHRRINKLVSPENLKLTNDNLIIIPMSSVDFPQLLVREGRNGLEMTEVFVELKRQLLEIDNLKLVCIDPLQAFVGADITSKPEAAQFMWTCFAKIAAQSGATLLATHHMRKDGMAEIKTAADAREGIRGTTGLVDGARAAFVMWQAIREIGECIAKQMNLEYEAHRFIQGAIVKANDEADHNVTSYYREDTGFLKCLGMVDTDEAASRREDILPATYDFVLRAIRNCLVDKGRFVTLGGGRGTVWAISYEDLRGTLDQMGYRKLVEKEDDTSKDIANRVRSSTWQARAALAKKGYIGMDGDWMWSLKKAEEKTIAEQVKDEVFESPRVIHPAFENEFK